LEEEETRRSGLVVADLGGEVVSARVNVNPEGEPLRPPRYDSPNVNPKGEPLQPRPPRIETSWKSRECTPQICVRRKVSALLNVNPQSEPLLPRHFDNSQRTEKPHSLSVSLVKLDNANTTSPIIRMECYTLKFCSLGII
jgi:hypothetical protein